MEREVASLMFHCGWEPEHGEYKIVLLPNAVRFDVDGQPTVQTVTAHVYREADGERTALPVNSAPGAKHYLVMQKVSQIDTVYKSAVSSVAASTLATAKSVRFDLVDKSDVGPQYSYSDSKIIVSEAVAITHDGTQGSFPSIAFTRSKTKPDAPEGGTYLEPVPTTPGWSDAPPQPAIVPNGGDPAINNLWMSRATFKVDATEPPAWSDPSPVADDVDIEFVFTPIPEEPGIPADVHPHPNYNRNQGDGWGKTATDAVWMAVAKKSGGAWGEWNVVRVKGETGKNVVFARVSPEVVEMKKGVLNYKAYVDVYDGGVRVPQSDVSYPLLTAGGSGSWLITNVVKWNFGGDNDRFYYLFQYIGTNTDVNTDISINVTYKGKQYPVEIPLRSKMDGDKGDKGDDAVVYSLVVNPTQVHYDLNTGKYDTSAITCSVIKVKGDSMTPLTNLASEGLTLNHANYLDGVLVAEKAYNGSVVLSSVLYSRIDFILKKGGMEIARQSTSIARHGENGTTGKNGVWVPPPMLWDDYPDGYEFKCGDVANGETHMDMALVRYANGDGELGYKIRRCRVSHTKSVDHNPLIDVYDKNDHPDGYWEQTTGAYKFLATDLLWANVGQINFLNGQAIRVGDAGGMCGYFGVPVGGAVFFSGGSEVTTATYVVYSDGRARWGNANGRRIEMDPMSGRMLVYGSDGKLCAIHSGEMIDYAKVGQETGSGASVTVAVSAMSNTVNGSKSEVKVLASGTATKEGVLKVTLPNISIDCFGNVATGSTEMIHNVKAVVYLQILVDGTFNTSQPLVYVPSGESMATVANIQPITVNIPAGKTYTVQMMYTTYLASGGVSQFIPLGTADVSLEVANKVCHYGANGWYISSSNQNYAYFLMDAAGRMHAKVMCGGAVMFDTDTNGKHF